MPSTRPKWWTRRGVIAPFRFTAGYLANEIAHGLGVVSQSTRERTAVPLHPVLIRRGR